VDDPYPWYEIKNGFYSNGHKAFTPKLQQKEGDKWGTTVCKCPIGSTYIQWEMKNTSTV